uniref:Uncharacterized protein n=1 Tax=Arion vulgaris TaxID=1028688 RepID=A0A0B7BGP5_9EUPU
MTLITTIKMEIALKMHNVIMNTIFPANDAAKKSPGNTRNIKIMYAIANHL